VVNSLRQENALLNRGLFKLVSNLQEEKQKLAEVRSLRFCLILNMRAGGWYGLWISESYYVEFSCFYKLDLKGWGLFPGAYNVSTKQKYCRYYTHCCGSGAGSLSH
jgi:hypothetical protein